MESKNVCDRLRRMLKVDQTRKDDETEISVMERRLREVGFTNTEASSIFNGLQRLQRLKITEKFLCKNVIADKDFLSVYMRKQL